MNVGYHPMNTTATDPSLESLCCFVCSHETNLLRCSRCRSIYYCGPLHQRLDWDRHRLSCQPPMAFGEPTTMALSSTVVPQTADMSHHSSDVLMASMASNSGSISGQTSINELNSINEFQSLQEMVDTNQNNDNFVIKQDFILSKLNTYCESIVRDLNEFGFCVIDDFLNNGTDILAEVVFLYKNGLFKAGQVVNNKVPNTHLIRGDHIVWVDGTEEFCSNIGFLIQTLDSIVMRCNAMQSDGQLSKYRINRRTKAMIACYPGNSSKYVRHIDNPNNDGRCITSIYYLNKDYNRERDGGVLRLFPQITSCVADIEPKYNRVIFFWSDRRNPHEVMPSNRLRFAITVWYFDANERETALQRYRQESLKYPVDKDLRPF